MAANQHLASTQAPLGEITQAFINTTAGSLAAANIPDYMYPITRQTLLDSRAQRLQGFNAYRTVFGLAPFTRYCWQSQGLLTHISEATILTVLKANKSTI